MDGEMIAYGRADAWFIRRLKNRSINGLKYAKKKKKIIGKYQIILILLNNKKIKR